VTASQNNAPAVDGHLRQRRSAAEQRKRKLPPVVLLLRSSLTTKVPACLERGEYVSIGP
jgi:hypothetical protein